MATRRARRAGGWLLLALVAGCLSPLSATAPQALAAGKNAPKFYLKRPPAGTPIDVLSERIIYDSRTDVATALGRVQIVWGPYVLLAHKVIYNRRTDRFQAEGEVYLREPEGNVLLADFVNIDDKFRDGFARHLRLIMTNGATMTARYAVRRQGYLTIYTDVAYTACKTCRLASGRPVWELRSQQVTHDQREGRIYHRNVTLRMWDVPVFWLPWISHPDPAHPRASGFLAPGFSYSRALGLGVAAPYFVNLAPNYDITLIPTIYSKQGVLARAVWRHNVGSGTYRVDAGGIYQLQPKKVASPGDKHLRWYAKADGAFAINRRWQWGFSGAVQSERTMMRRYGVDSRDVIHSRLWLAGLDGRNYFYAEAGHLDGLLGTDKKRTDQGLLPWLYHEYTFNPPVMGGVLSLSSTFRTVLQSDPTTPFAGVNVPERQSLLALRLHWQREWASAAGVLFQPFLDVRNELRDVKKLPDPAASGGVRDHATSFRALPSAGLDVRMPFVADLPVGYHVLTPVAQIVAASNEYGRREAGNTDTLGNMFSAATVFLHDRYSGLDRFEGGVRANLGLAYGLYMNDGGFLRFSVGESFHLAGKNSFAGTNIGLGRRRSDLVGGLAVSLSDAFLLSWQGRFDPTSLKPRDQEAGLEFSFARLRGSVDFARIVADPASGRMRSERQVSAQASFLLSGNWQLFGGWQYDLKRKWTLKRYIGVGYECDCMAVSLKYTETNSSDADAIIDRSLSVSIRLLTLGGGGLNSPEEEQ